MFKSSHRRCSVTKGVLRNFSKFRGKHLRQILFLNKVAGLLFNMAQVFSCEFAKFLRAPFVTEHLRSALY